jgi:hypothetical protein
MSSQFVYVQLNFGPKIGAERVPLIKQHEAVVEVPKDLVQRKQSALPCFQTGISAVRGTS